MRTVSYRLADLSKATIRIGRVGENDYTRVIFDSKTVFDDYPRAVPALTVKPPAGAAYPAVATREGDLVIWDVTDSDLVVNGYGEAQLTFTEDGVVCKSCIARVIVDRSIRASGQAPDPVEDWLVEANTALNAIPQTIDDALAEAKASGEFDGEDGFSPVATVSKSGNKSTITITDKNGTTTAVVNDGEKGDPGDPGDPGEPGVSPTVTVTDITGGHRVTVTDAEGSRSFDVMDGEKGDPGTPGDPTKLIDDSSTTATDKVWSAKKSADTVSTLNNQIDAKQTAPASGAAAGKVLGLALVDGQLVPVWDGFPVSDVQVNGTSILNQGVANVPVATGNDLGVVKAPSNMGILVENGILKIAYAGDGYIKAGSDARQPIVPWKQHAAVFYGLAKAAGADMASVSGATVGVYPEAQKVAIQKMLGIYEAPWELIREDTVTNATEANIEITVDGNGQAFELTDVGLVFWFPTQDTVATKGDYGRVSFNYGEDYSDKDNLYIGAFTQNAGATSKVAYCWVEQKNGMVFKHYTPNTNNNGNVNTQTLATYTEDAGLFIKQNRIYTKIIITSVVGKAQYRLYGRRKWTV